MIRTNETAEVTLGGQRRTLDLSADTWKAVCERLNRPFAELPLIFVGPGALKAVCVLIHQALITYDKSVGRPDSVTEYQVMDMILSNMEEAAEIGQTILKVAGSLSDPVVGLN